MNQIQFIRAHPHTMQRITEYLEKAGWGNLSNEPLFVRIDNAFTFIKKTLTGHAIYKDVVKHYARKLGLESRAVCVHGLHAAAATNDLDPEADIAKVKKNGWAMPALPLLCSTTGAK